jgi:hypothetical protein
VRGTDDGEVVSPSSLKIMSRPCLANYFPSEVLSWFIDVFSEETASSISSFSSVSSSGESEESSSLASSSESHSLFLTVEDLTSSSNLHLPLSLDVIL